MIILRHPEWIEQLMCFAFKKCKSVMMDSTEPAGTHEKPDQSTGEMLSLLNVEIIDQLLTLEVLCPSAQWIMRRQFRQRKSITLCVGESHQA